MDRIEKAKEKHNELFGHYPATTYPADPEFQNIINKFIFGEIYQRGNINDKLRGLITLVLLATGQNMKLLKAHVNAALNIELTPIEIKEAIYQCAPYIGFPKTFDALNEVNEVFKTKGIETPIASQKTTEEDTRFNKGLAVQEEIFGDIIAKLRKNAAANQVHIQDYLSAFCFGDFYTRNGLDLKTRELLTLCIITALGGAESQLMAHIQGNKTVGNNKDTLIAVITQCLPYIGFPRTLNALACVNEIIPEN